MIVFMAHKNYSQIEINAADQFRRAAKADLFELCPKLRPDAVDISVVPSGGSLDVKGDVVGNTAPYSVEEVQYYMAELGLKSLGQS